MRGLAALAGCRHERETNSMPKLQRQPAQHRRACDSVRHLHRSPNGYANEMESEMNAQHTPGLLKLHTKYPQDMVTPDGHYTVARTLPQPTIAVAVANARRLVACWNACEGLSTEKLENIDMLGDTLAGRFEAFHASERELMDVRDELLEALKECIEDSEQAVCEYIEKYGETYRPQRLQAMRDTVAKARAAIAKATRGAA